MENSTCRAGRNERMIQSTYPDTVSKRREYHPLARLRFCRRIKERCSIGRRAFGETTPKKTMGADLPQDQRPCLYLSSPMEN